MAYGCAYWLLRWGSKLAAVLFVLILIWIGFHVIPAWIARDNPPLTCQILGGHWNLWSGWTCS